MSGPDIDTALATHCDISVALGILMERYHLDATAAADLLRTIAPQP